MFEHLRISAFTGKRVKDDDDSAIKKHLLFCNHTSDFKDFSSLAINNDDKFFILRVVILSHEFISS